MTEPRLRRYAALLRGVNVGGKNRLPMKDLAALFVEAGCSAVETYIQSGNVVFSGEARVVKTLAEVVSTGILGRFGFKAPVVIRSGAQLEELVRANPFLQAASGQEASDVKYLHVAFLSGAPLKERVAALDPERSPGDRFEVLGSEIFFCLPHGVARTKLTNEYFDRTLGVVSTLRNWNTVLRLVDLLGEDRPSITGA